MSISKPKSPRQGKPGERSFTLLETMAAMSLMITVLLHVSGAQGDIVVNAEYGRNITKAMWLAKAVMSKVDYYWDYQELKQLESEGKIDRAEFKEMDLPNDDDNRFRYSVRIEEWKFPILDLLQNGGFQENAGEDSQESAAAASPFPVKDILKSILGDHILKVAQVEVFWPDGTDERSVRLSYLLTNQRAVDQQVFSMDKTYKKLLTQVKNEGKGPPRNSAECRERNPELPIYDKNSKKCVAKKTK